MPTPMPNPSPQQFVSFTPSNANYTIIKQHTPYFENTEIEPKFIVLHCIGSEDPFTLLQQHEVSAHFLIPCQTTPGLEVVQLVEPTLRARHAGVSQWFDYVNLNDYAIGIEIHMPNYANVLQAVEPDFRYVEAYEPRQIEALIELVKDLQQQFNILAQNILAHSDIAPYRIIDGKPMQVKTDPGPSLPWRELAQHGIGVWPAVEFKGDIENIELTAELAQTLLKSIGYQVPQSGEFDVETLLVLDAFRAMHYNDYQQTGFIPQITEFDFDTYKMLFNLSQGLHLPSKSI